MIELTEEQIQAVAAEAKGPVQILNPRTREIFVLIHKEVYDLTTRIMSGANRRGWDSPADDDLIRKQA